MQILEALKHLIIDQDLGFWRMWPRPRADSASIGAEVNASL